MYKRQLKGVTAKQITLRINSEGGSVFQGHAIYNTLRDHPADINVKIDGLAASIASIIAMAGDTIEMAENAFMMIHDPWTLAAGTADELRTQADMMDKVREKLLNTYVKRTGGDEEKISNMMSEETWMDAEEALQHGFIDSINEENRMAACVRHPESFKCVPDTLIAKRTPRKDRVKRDINSYITGSLKSYKL